MFTICFPVRCTGSCVESAEATSGTHCDLAVNTNAALLPAPHHFHSRSHSSQTLRRKVRWHHHSDICLKKGFALFPRRLRLCQLLVQQLPGLSDGVIQQSVIVVTVQATTCLAPSLCFLRFGDIVESSCSGAKYPTTFGTREMTLRSTTRR